MTAYAFNLLNDFTRMPMLMQLLLLLHSLLSVTAARQRPASVIAVCSCLLCLCF